MEEIKKKPHDVTKEFSELIAEFKISKFYAVISEKLSRDYEQGVLDIIAKENDLVRGRVQYIAELRNWIDAKSNEKQFIEFVEKIEKEDY